jgi:hypothetical protein
MAKKEIAIAEQGKKLKALTSANLPETKRQYLSLYYGSKKVKDYTEADLKSLFEFLRALSKLLGITEAPDKAVIMLIIEHIQDHHSDFSQAEIKRAFSLAAAGKLEMDFVHYNRITPQLISKVLNKYKQLRSKEVVVFENNLKLKEREEGKRKPTPEELKDMQISTCTKVFIAYQEEKKKPKSEQQEVKDYGNFCYDFLEEIGCIKLSNEVKQEIYTRARVEVVTDANKKQKKTKFEKPVASLMSELARGNNSKVVIKSKQIALEEYFDALIDMELNILDEIQEALDSQEVKPK